jgi:preprotein translocase subunit YajC
VTVSEILLGQAAAGGGGLGMIGMMVAMFGIMYFILIRPQQKKMKEHQSMLGALQKGDTVITRGGVIGKISGIQDNLITLELQEKVRVRVLKSYIESKFNESSSASAKSEAKKAEPATEQK